jgi:2'-5' RNA ligase
VSGKRLFVGARVSIATANALAGCAETLARRARDAGVDLRWVAPANYHVTLAFLGWTRDDALGAVTDALRDAVAGATRLSFRTTRLGGFAALDKATVLWAGIDDGGGLARLAEPIADAASRLGFARDRRPYTPHVTLARLREPRALREVVLPMAEQMFGDTKIDSVTLFESETKSTGSVYREIEKIAFQPAATRGSEAEKRQTEALERGTPERDPRPEPDETDDGWPRGQGPTE